MNNAIKCPVCNQGDLIEGVKGYMCNHFKSVDDKCSFTIFKSYFGKEMTADLVRQLAENAETAIFDDLISKGNKPFSAKLVIENNVVKPKFQGKSLDTPCPKCGKKVHDLSKAFICEGFFNKECDLYINKNVASVLLSDYDAEVLLNGSSTAYRIDFLSNSNKRFGAKLFLDDAHQVKFNYELVKCPKCLTGSVSVNHWAYGCSNFKDNEIKCDFSVWRERSGEELAPVDLLELCQNGRSELKKFKANKNESYSGFYQFDKDFKLVIVENA